MAYEATEVPVERSQGEIRRLLNAHKASNFSFGEGSLDGAIWAQVQFVQNAQQVRMLVPLKEPDRRVAAAKAQRARTRTVEQIISDMVEQEAKRIWRVLFHTLKARLVAVEEGVETFEEAFLAHLVDPVTGRTLWEQVKGFVESGALKLGGGGIAIGQPALNAGPPLRAIPGDDDDIIDGEVVEG